MSNVRDIPHVILNSIFFTFIALFGAIITTIYIMKTGLHIDYMWVYKQIPAVIIGNVKFSIACLHLARRKPKFRDLYTFNIIVKLTALHIDLHRTMEAKRV